MARSQCRGSRAPGTGFHAVTRQATDRAFSGRAMIRRRAVTKEEQAYQLRKRAQCQRACRLPIRHSPIVCTPRPSQAGKNSGSGSTSRGGAPKRSISRPFKCSQPCVDAPLLPQLCVSHGDRSPRVARAEVGWNDWAARAGRTEGAETGLPSALRRSRPRFRAVSSARIRFHVRITGAA
jgi:hypothetical protein